MQPLGGRLAHYRIGDRRFSSPVTACTSEVCILEVSGIRAGEIATTLASGHDLRLEISDGTEPSGRLDVPAGRFAEGLKELIRLRQGERHRGPG